MPTELTIIGAGGHAKVVMDAVNSLGFKQCYILDNAQNKCGSFIQNYQVNLLEGSLKSNKFHIAIGVNQVRFDLYNRYSSSGKFVTLVSPKADITNTAIIKDGVFVAPRVVVSSDAVIGKGCIINHGAIVDHDCSIGEFCHIAPAATLLGGVSLGNRVFVGAGAVILPGISITDDVVIGAGAVVTSDILEKCTLVGVPAKVI